MAPIKPPSKAAPSATPKKTHTGTVLEDVKSSFINTKAMFRALKPKQDAKVNKPTIARTPAAERDRLKQNAERLSQKHSNLIEEAPEPHSTLASNEKNTLGHSHPDPSLSAQDFEVGGKLGRGKFGRVYLARHVPTNYICALKIIAKAQCTDEQEERLIRRELEIHQNLAHRNILKLLSWFHDEKSVYLVLEFAPGGSLFSKLNKQPKGRFDEQTVAHYIAQMAEALRYMHSKNIMHRDIKPENILLGLYNEIKLADFGYSVHTESGFRSTVCGTLDYLSPEVALMMLKPGQSKDFYTKAIDQWSLGILTYELLVGKPPFEMKSGAATQKKIANFRGQGLKFPGHVSQRAKELIKDLLNFDAENRMSLDDVLQHPWITGHLDRPKQPMDEDAVKAVEDGA